MAEPQSTTRRSACRRAALATLLAATATVSQAQLSGNVGADSDYRFRGISLSDSGPDRRASVDYDAANGWYAGATATAAALERGHRYPWLLGYFGYVRRGARGLDWELGATGSHAVGGARYDYAEAYAGLLGERWNLRVYYSPDYFGRGVQTAYAELNGSVAIRPRLRLLAHTGVLAIVAGHSVDGARGWRGDARIGLGAALDPVDLQLAWVGASRGGPPIYGARSGRWVLSATLAF